MSSFSSLHPSLLQVLESYDPYDLSHLLQWRHLSGPHTLETVTSELSDLMPLKTDRIDFKLDELIRFSLLDEFGPQIHNKSSFSLLFERILTRLVSD